MEGLGMSLDEIISNKKKSSNSFRRRNQRRGGGNNSGRRTISKPSNFSRSTNSNIRRKKDEGSKIMISNLEYKVTEKDLKDLFGEIGPIHSASLNFDQNGRSKGTGHVIFKNKNDASRAAEKYNNVTLDGRAMKIEIVLSTESIPSSLNSRIRRSNNNNNNGNNNGRNNNRGNRGRGNMRRNRFNNKSSEPNKSAEQLDAEMDAYMNTDE